MKHYKEYLFKELSNHLYKMMNKDTESFFSNQGPKIESIYIQDFIEFYTEGLKLTPTEILKAMEDDVRHLSEVLYSPYFQKFEQRMNWVKIFEEDLVKNPKFFAEALKICLSLHSNLLIKNYDDKMKDVYIKENKEIFESIVRIGKENGSFKNISQNSLRTSYVLYKNILEQEGIFNSEFSFLNLKNSFIKNDKNFFNTYMIDSIDFIESNPEKITDIYDSVEASKKFVEELLSVKDPVIFERQSNFIFNLIKNDHKFRELVSKDGKRAICENHQDFIIPYFDSLNDLELHNIFYNHKNYINNLTLTEVYGSKAQNWISTLLEESKKAPINFEIIDCILSKMLFQNPQATEEVEFYSCRVKLYFLKIHIQDNNFKVKQGLPTKEKEIINYLEKNINSIKFDIKNRRINEDINNFKEIYNFVKEKNIKLLPILNESVYLSAKEIIKEIFSEGNQFNKSDNIELLSQIIKDFECPEVLQYVIESNQKWDKEITIRIKNDKRKDNYIDKPFVFALIDSSSIKTFEWLLNSSQLEVLADIKYKNKGIIEHLCLKNNFEEYLNVLVESPQGFKKLVLENKKTLKKLSTSKNENIKTKTMFVKMEDNLKIKEVKNKTLKI